MRIIAKAIISASQSKNATLGLSSHNLQNCRLSVSPFLVHKYHSNPSNTNPTAKMNAAHHNSPAPTKMPVRKANNAAISSASRLIRTDITSLKELKEGREWLDETTPYL
jgi:hypothetical protein